MKRHLESANPPHSNWLRLRILRLPKAIGADRYLLGYSGATMVILLFITAVQYNRFEMFGTELLLGWDSPNYVWMANEVINKGVSVIVQHWGFPQLYTLLVALFGYLSGNVVNVERILPMFFGVILIVTNYKLTLSVTNHVHIAGVSALLTGISLNFLRLLSDLHRNLMAYSLGLIVIYLASELDKKRILERRYIFFVLLSIVIANTHIETFLMLLFCMVLFSLLSWNAIIGVKVLSACLVSAIIPIIITPAVLEYPTAGMMVGVVQSEQHLLSPGEVMLWGGGSWLMVVFLLLGVVYLFRQDAQTRDKRGLPLICWLLTIAFLLIAVSVVGFPITFAQRTMLVLPVSVVTAFSIGLAGAYLKRVDFTIGVFKHSSRLLGANLRRPILVGIALLLIANSLAVTFYQSSYFLTPYISRDVYDGVRISGEYLEARSFSLPILLFYGQSSFRAADVVRNYWGAEFGEHFAYYGPFESLIRLESSVSFSLPEERALASRYFMELVGNKSYVEHISQTHSVYVRDKASLVSRPIVIITPQLYEHYVPYHLRRFFIGRGIYIIPPDSIVQDSGMIYGPPITVLRNGASTQIRVEYLYVDPFDPSIFYVRVNGSRGFESYNFTDIPQGFRFVRLEQGGALSGPEFDPRRLDGSTARTGNDPADTQMYWSSWQHGNITVDSSFRKEGSGSLQITGETNEWGTLFATYDSPGTWDLISYSILSVWAKSNVTATLALNLHDLDGKQRAYWDVRASGESISAQWKRFVVDLDDYTHQDDGFNMSAVDYVASYVFLDSWTSVSFSIDDLTVDGFFGVEEGIYKARVLLDETVIVYLMEET